MEKHSEIEKKMFENFKNVWPKMCKKCTGVLRINYLHVRKVR